MRPLICSDASEGVSPCTAMTRAIWVLRLMFIVRPSFHFAARFGQRGFGSDAMRLSIERHFEVNKRIDHSI